MFTKTIEDILTLFAMTILADRRLFMEEMEVFMDLSSTIEQFNTGPAKLSGAAMLEWFENHKAELLVKLETPDFDSWFYGILDRLAPLENKNVILQAMGALSIADDNVHVSERALLSLTAEHWKIED